MVDVALNFKKLASEKHRVYRTLQAHSDVAGYYKYLIKAIGKYRGAIIFPEQFLALTGQDVYSTTVVRDPTSTSISVQRVPAVVLMNGEAKVVLKTMDEVVEAEQDGAFFDRGERYFFTLRSVGNSKDGRYNSYGTDIYLSQKMPATRFWFSNKADAISFGKTQLVFG